MKSKYNLSEDEIARMGKDYDDLLKRVGTLEFGPLPEAVSNALTQLAAQYPDMLTFDAKRGDRRPSRIWFILKSSGCGGALWLVP